MQIGNFRFEPSLLAVVMTVLSVGVFGYLSVWQLGRADERKQLLDQVLQKAAMQVADFDATTINSESDTYRRFRLQGSFLNQHQVLLDNIVRNGKAGYEVITPFKTPDAVVLVNRGWIEAGRDRRVLPDVSLETESLTVVASMSQPRSAPVVGNNVVESGIRWTYLDLDHYRSVSGLEVPSYVMLLSADSGPGYDRNWPEVKDKSGMHIGYAIHWAAFALIALATFLGLNIKRVKQ